VRSFAGVGRLDKARLLQAPLHWPRPSVMEISLRALDGVGPRLAAAAADAGLERVGDLLGRVPHSYRERGQICPIAELKEGEEATVAVEVRKASLRRARGRRLTILEVSVADQSATVKASWFNQPWLQERMTPGVRMLLVGGLDKRGFRVSEFEFLASQPPAVARGAEGPRGAPRRPAAPAPDHGLRRAAPGIHTTGLVPVHPGTEKLRPQRLRDWTWQACGWAANTIEALPAELRARRDLAAVADAICAVHFPRSASEVIAARRRLAFEELFLYQAALSTRRRLRRAGRPAPRLGKPGALVGRWIDSLPFAPTADQLAAFAELDTDLDSGEPMQRLLMGEVGSGKTVVALYAMLRALEAGYQAVLMAPTETLAEQHAATLNRLLGAEPLPFALLTAATPALRRRQALGRLASGELGLVLGTHALIEPEVEFARLAVCVVDEQHRFGVQQRSALDAKGLGGAAPHVLHMTATPIPRTLSLTAYGDLDTTELHELPAGREPVETWLVEENRRPGAYRFVRERLREGRQAYVVCPLVAESEKLQGKAAEAEAARLAAEEFREHRVGVLHGQMHSNRKAEAMEAFACGATDVLVATTVIEVGIDVANATVILIEGAERYGVSQLHQLRGRVGRGEHPSQCLLFAEQAGELARRRLQAVAAERDGFRLAEVDLALRGEGEILGTRQHGLPRFAVASLPADTPTLIAARDEVLALLRRHGSLEDPELGPLMEVARRRFGAGLADPIPL
jgi:ATP-dependent DNA helicase RecG